MNTDIRIRRLAATDASAIARIFAAPRVIAGSLQQPYPGDAFWRQRLQSYSARDHMLVAEIEDCVVGVAGLHGNENPRRRHVATLSIVVSDDWQRRGIGRLLLTHLLDLADNWLGLLRVELDVFADNAGAIALYESAGFQHEGRKRADALRNGTYADGLIMARLHPNPPSIRPEAST